MQMNSGQIEALLVERLGYERRGKHDRAAAVAALLRSLGYTEEAAPLEVAAVEPAVERAAKRKTKKREI